MNTSLRLNSLPSSVFDGNPVDEVGKISVIVNGEKVNRAEIVATGRLAAAEYMGKKISEHRFNGAEKYVSRLGDTDYGSISKFHNVNKFMFCAAKAYEAVGKEAPTSYEEAKRDSQLSRDRTFLATMAAIDRDVLDPLFFAVWNDVGGSLMQWEATPMGSTKQIDIRSNDIFLFEDSSWGSGRSTSKNYLYGKTVTLTPKMYSCNATIKWYQDIVNGDAGRYYAAIMNGMWNKIYAILISGFQTAIADTGAGYIPASLSASTYTTENWITITDKVAAANGVQVTDLMAIGSRTSLSHVLPVDSTGGAITGLQYGLGREWFGRGFLPNAGGVDLMPITPAIVPGTQNSTLDTIDLGDSIYILAKGGMGYAPMFGVYAEGNPITLTATPSETADFTIDINVGAMFEIKPIFASKVGVITEA